MFTFYIQEASINIKTNNKDSLSACILYLFLIILLPNIRT